MDYFENQTATRNLVKLAMAIRATQRMQKQGDIFSGNRFGRIGASFINGIKPYISSASGSQSRQSVPAWQQTDAYRRSNMTPEARAQMDQDAAYRDQSLELRNRKLSTMGKAKNWMAARNPLFYNQGERDAARARLVAARSAEADADKMLGKVGSKGPEYWRSLVQSKGFMNLSPGEREQYSLAHGGDRKALDRFMLEDLWGTQRSSERQPTYTGNPKANYWSARADAFHSGTPNSFMRRWEQPELDQQLRASGY